MLQVEGLTVHYGAAIGVRDVSFVCGPGELVAIVGPNGAGKSTLLGAVAGGLQDATVEGTILLDGEPILGVVPERIVRRGLSLVPEGRRIFGTLTVAENLCLAAGTRASSPDLFTHVQDLFPELVQYAKKPAGLLSGGQQQQLAIARALLCKPRMLLLDEPSLGLSPLLIGEVFDAIARLRESGMSIVLVEQHARRAIATADRTYVLHKGVVDAVGTAADTDRLEAAYWGQGEVAVR
jgi:branched-chain amino acid transport system ATP-binding protein